MEKFGTQEKTPTKKPTNHSIRIGQKGPRKSIQPNQIPTKSTQKEKQKIASILSKVEKRANKKMVVKNFKFEKSQLAPHENDNQIRQTGKYSKKQATTAKAKNGNAEEAKFGNKPHFDEKQQMWRFFGGVGNDQHEWNREIL